MKLFGHHAPNITEAEFRKLRTLNIETGEWDAGLTPAEVVNRYALIKDSGTIYVRNVETKSRSDKTQTLPVDVRKTPQFEIFAYDPTSGVRRHTTVDAVQGRISELTYDPAHNEGKLSVVTQKISSRGSNSMGDINLPAGMIGKIMIGVGTERLDPLQEGIGRNVSKDGLLAIANAGLLPEFTMVYDMRTIEAEQGFDGDTRFGSAAVASQVSVTE